VLHRKLRFVLLRIAQSLPTIDISGSRRAESCTVFKRPGRDGVVSSGLSLGAPFL
jgi:hypothetical protein